MALSLGKASRQTVIEKAFERVDFALLEETRLRSTYVTLMPHLFPPMVNLAKDKDKHKKTVDQLLFALVPTRSAAVLGCEDELKGRPCGFAASGFSRVLEGMHLETGNEAREVGDKYFGKDGSSWRTRGHGPPPEVGFPDHSDATSMGAGALAARRDVADRAADAEGEHEGHPDASREGHLWPRHGEFRGPWKEGKAVLRGHGSICCMRAPPPRCWRR